MTRVTPGSLGVLAACLLCPALAVASGEDGHGHAHDLPPEYAAPGWSLPPVSYVEPEYPLAAAFIEADASNFTAGGIDEVQYVVVHTMQGSYAGSINWFLNPSSDVSAHFCIRSEDGEITQMVHLGDRAWHVGNSNSWAIGIEHEGFVDDASWYTYVMYERSAELARWLADHFSLPLDRDHIVGHVELPNQTHTDPGGNWNWDLYMALVKEIVGEGRVEGVVVDPALACTLTATSDTYVKATLQDQGDLGDADKCFVAAGTELAYLHAGEDRVGHRSVVLADDGPCAALGQGFAFADHFSGFCAPEDLAVAGATVTLDGGAPVVVGPDGTFVWTDVGEGAHTIDASATDFEPTSLPIEHGGYPGVRVVVRLPSSGAAGDGDSTGAAPPSDDGPIPPQPDPGSSEGGGDGTGSDAPDVDDEPALPETFGENEDAAGCGCQAPDRRGGASWLAMLVLPMLARRRRAHAVG